MPFDPADTSLIEATVLPRSPLPLPILLNVIALRDFLKTLKPAQLQMYGWDFGDDNECGTAACLGGWQGILANDRHSARGSDVAWVKRRRDALAIDEKTSDELFWGRSKATPQQAVNMLNYYISTGKVDWTYGNPELV